MLEPGPDVDPPSRVVVQEVLRGPLELVLAFLVRQGKVVLRRNRPPSSERGERVLDPRACAGGLEDRQAHIRLRSEEAGEDGFRPGFRDEKDAVSVGDEPMLEIPLAELLPRRTGSSHDGSGHRAEIRGLSGGAEAVLDDQPVSASHGGGQETPYGPKLLELVPKPFGDADGRDDVDKAEGIVRVHRR